jgi:hypothetical protein
MRQWIPAVYPHDYANELGLDTVGIWGGTSPTAVMHTHLAQTVAPVACTWRNLLIVNDLDDATWTVYKNGVATALEAISVGGVAVCVGVDVSLAAGDYLRPDAGRHGAVVDALPPLDRRGRSRDGG